MASTPIVSPTWLCQDWWQLWRDAHYPPDNLGLVGQPKQFPLTNLILSSSFLHKYSRCQKILKPEFQLQPTVHPSAKQRAGSSLPWAQFVSKFQQYFGPFQHALFSHFWPVFLYFFQAPGWRGGEAELEAGGGEGVLLPLKAPLQIIQQDHQAVWALVSS